MKKIGVLVGSLRKDSHNKIVAKEIVKNLPSDYEVEFLEIGNLPLYNEDIDGETPPQEYVNYRNKLAEKDAFLILTPEYNRGTTAALKNALDVGSRPYGQSKFNGKPVAVGSVSMGALSGALANHQVRQTLVFLNMPVLQQPELYVGNTWQFIENGEITSEDTKGFLKNFADAYVEHINRY